MTSPDDNLPVIGISMGEPNGIGPEVVVKALADPALHDAARFVVYGRNELLTLAADRAGIRPYWFRVAHGSDRARGSLLPPVTVVDFHEIDFIPPHEAAPCRTGGHLSKPFVEEAIADALGTEDADYSDAACSDAGRRRLGVGGRHHRFGGALRALSAECARGGRGPVRAPSQPTGRAPPATEYCSRCSRGTCLLRPTSGHESPNRRLAAVRSRSRSICTSSLASPVCPS